MEQKHTEEPWIVGEYGCPIVMQDRNNIICFTDNGVDARIETEARQYANAARIVACVNACAGIPTEALESGVVAEMVALVEVSAKIKKAGILKATSDRMYTERTLIKTISAKLGIKE